MNVDDLWDDLRDNWSGFGRLDSDDEDYFLGTIVTVLLITKPSILLDASSVIATITIMLCCIRDELRRVGTAEARSEKRTISKNFCNPNQKARQPSFYRLNVEDARLF